MKVVSDPSLGVRVRLTQTTLDATRHVRNLSLSCSTNSPMEFSVFIEKGIEA